jgi:hypothetical protein
MRKVLQADLQVRPWVVVLFAVTTVVGAATIFVGSRTVGRSALSGCLPDAAYESTFGRLSLLAWALTWGVTALTLLVAYLMARLSVFTWRSGTFPPPGTHTLHPVPVRTGSAAKRRALGGIVVAVFLTGFSIMLPVLMTTLAERFLAA